MRGASSSWWPTTPAPSWGTCWPPPDRWAATRRPWGVAPLSVLPARQRTGVGTALVLALIEAAEDRGWPLLVVLGDPAYCGRLRFEPAATLGIAYAPVAPDDTHFQARRLAGDDGSLRAAFASAGE